MTFLILSLSIFLLFGCASAPKQVDVMRPPDSANRQQTTAIAKRFQEPPPQGRTVVESAIELSEKYAKLSQEAATLSGKNQDLIAQNSQLQKHATTLEAKLKQTQKELTQANDLLIEMRIELNNWKTDVLGFREEMREAEKAELKALLDILKILGGEVTAESAKDEDASLALAPPNEPTQLAQHETSTLGTANE